MESTITHIKRARTPEQKSDRRETILTTAKVLFMETGYEGFSMGLLSNYPERGRFWISINCPYFPV